MAAPPARARDQIQMRDPFVLPVSAERRYYLFGTTDTNAWSGLGTGFDCYASADLLAWEGPIPAFRPPAGFWANTQFWAPEVHVYRGRWYMFASFAGPGRRRGTQVLVADAPAGPYLPHSDGPVTPGAWECLDGSLHIDAAGRPWIVYCHEWVQIRDGGMYAQRLADDLSRAVGEPLLLFTASQAPWTNGFPDPRSPGMNFVTDGPFLHRAADGSLLMLWSSSGREGYAMGVARSTGGVTGPWFHAERPVFAKDGGHGMLFRTFAGALMMTLHAPNDTPRERPCFIPVREVAGGLVIDA